MPCTYEQFVNGIRFQDIEPMTKTVVVTFPLNTIHSNLKAMRVLETIDVSLAILPEGQDEFMELFKPILDIPRMSTFAIAAIISRTVGQMPPGSAYVNVGIWHGYSLLAGMLGNPDRTVIGVDNFSQFGGPRDEAQRQFKQLKSESHFLYDMDYKDYFSNAHEGEIGCYFYDGNHSYENQLHGLREAEPYFATNCVIMVDDTNWPEPRQATLDFIEKSSNSYDVFFDRSTSWNGHPTFWNGFMLLRRTA